MQKVIRGVTVLRPKVIRPNSVQALRRRLSGARFAGLTRRGKYLLFHLVGVRKREPFSVLGHLGMTGRMYLLPRGAALAKHTSVALDLGLQFFVFEDTRFFGRFTLDTKPMERLGPEPLSKEFTADYLRLHLQRSMQPIKVKLLDQRLVAGVGNIYASEALFRARISPGLPARRLSAGQVEQLRNAIRDVLNEAIQCGSTVPLNYRGGASGDRLFYFGRAPGTPDYYEERLLVYDRAGLPCSQCGTVIRRLVQAARSTYFCPQCQKRTNR